jgi:predicted HicB family RNase H-like nuclease
MKTVENDYYTYRVIWSAEDQAHVALCSEFPGLSWLASTPESALRGIRHTVAAAVEDLRAEGEPVPEPFAVRNYSGKFMVRIPPAMHRHLAMEAAEEQVSLNRLVSSRLAPA